MKKNREQESAAEAGEATARQPLADAEDAGGIRAVSRAFQVLRVLALGGEHGMRLTDVVRYCGLSRPTVHRLLQSLITEGVAEQEAGTRRYRVGLEISLLGLSRPARFAVRAAAEPYLQALADDLGDTVFLTIRAGSDSVAIDRKTGSYPIKVLAIEVGVRRPLGIGVAGIMLLATLEPQEAERICKLNAERLPAEGPTIQTIRNRVRTARAAGYAYSEVGVLRGTRAVAVPVLDAGGQALATITVSAMADRLSEAKLPQVVETLRKAATLISRRLAEMERASRSRAA